MKKFLAGILLAAMLLSACAGGKAPDQTKEPGATEEKQEGKTEEAKELVTDYDYFSQMSEEEKYVIFGKGSMKNAHLPKVNLDFPYAHYINYFILKNIIPSLQVYTPSMYGEDMGEWDSEKSYHNISYEYSVNDGILSLLIHTIADNDNAYQDQYYSFAMDIKTGEEVSFFEAMERLGYDKESIYSQILRKIRLACEESIPKENRENGISELMLYYPGMFYHVERQLLKRGGDLKIEFFIGENGKINFLPGAYWNRQKMIELDKTEEKPEINPSYEALGLPLDKDYAIYYAGESYDEESLRFAMRKVIGLYEAKKIDDKMLNAGIMHPYVNGEEQVVGADTFLIIPKYKNARISAFYEYYDEKSDKRIIESHYPVLQTVGDTVFLCKAASDSPGNVHIVVEYAGKRVEYIPTIELKDGKSVTPREAVNLNEEIVKIEPAALDNEKAKTLFTMFFDFVPKG